MAFSQHQIRKWVLSGAMHPVVMVEPLLRERLRDKYAGIWGDHLNKPFPWDPSPMLRDCLAAVMQSTFLRLGISNQFYWKLQGQVEERVFGRAIIREELQGNWIL